MRGNCVKPLKGRNGGDLSQMLADLSRPRFGASLLLPPEDDPTSISQ